MDEWEYNHPSQEIVVVAALELLAPGSAVLDVGCGTGVDAVFLATLGYRVIGVDISEKAIKLAVRRAQASRVAVDFRLGSALKLPVEDKAVDFVSDRGLFHHLDEEERSRYGHEIGRVLRPGGRALIRGAQHAHGGQFVPVTQASIEAAFLRDRFHLGPVLPLEMIANNGALTTNLVVVTRL
jgi:ubiquinone/menaquinone biosynthesis C-methylase UbiE